MKYMFYNNILLILPMAPIVFVRGDFERTTELPPPSQYCIPPPNTSIEHHELH